jgi:hypothetical protein
MIESNIMAKDMANDMVKYIIIIIGKNVVKIG